MKPMALTPLISLSNPTFNFFNTMTLQKVFFGKGVLFLKLHFKMITYTCKTLLIHATDYEVKNK